MTQLRARCLCGPRVHVRRPTASPVLMDAAAASRVGRADPTGTSGIQRRWSRALDQRWRSIARMLPAAVAARLDPVSHVTVSYLTGKSDPVIAFQGWLDEAMRQVVLGINGAWTLPYVREAADAGALHARRSVQVRDAFDPDQPRDDDGKWTTSGSSVVAYHGTTTNRLESIKKNGLKVSGVKRVYSKTSELYEGRERSVFVTSSFDEADSYAYQAKNAEEHIPGTKSAVLTLHVPKSEWQKFKSDEKYEGSYGTAGAYSTKNIPAKWIKKVTVADAAEADDDTVTMYVVVVEHPRKVRDAFDPDQPRDEDGKWTSGGEGGKIYELSGERYGADDYLYHGTSEKNIDSIRREGLKSFVGSMGFHLGVNFGYRESDASGYGSHILRIKAKHMPDDTMFNFQPGANTMTTVDPRRLEIKVGNNWRPLRSKTIKDAAPPQDRTHLLQALAITELQGVMEAVSQQLVRAFGNGVLLRKSATRIAADMRAVMDRTATQRGHLLVSFMVVRAHAAATLDGLRALGVQRVGLIPERTPAPPVVVADAKSRKGQVQVLTAEDDLVCPTCEEIAADGPYYIDEAEALIPAHPRCRCGFVPADDEEYDEVFGEDAYDPDQPRDENGMWTASGVAGATMYRGGTDKENPLGTYLTTDKRWASRYGNVSEHEVSEHVKLLDLMHPRAHEVWGKGWRSPESVGKNDAIDLFARAGTNDDYDGLRPEIHENIKAAGYHGIALAHGMGEGHTRVFVYPGHTRKKVKDSATHVASGIMVEADTGRVLFVRRAAKHGDHGGEWAFPGGAVEPGETIEEAAARETREEIGLDLGVEELEQHSRLETNGIDFTTFSASVQREFRPLLNEEHDAHRWAYVYAPPLPLHPGVVATLQGQGREFADEGTWDPDKHPRDKDGKFTEVGGIGGAEAKLESEFKHVGLFVQAPGSDEEHGINKFPVKGHAYEEHVGEQAPKGAHVYEVPEDKVGHFTSAAHVAGVDLEEMGPVNEDGTHHAFYVKGVKTPEKTIQQQVSETGAGVKTFGKKGLEEPGPDTVGASLVGEQAASVAKGLSETTPEHPSQKYLSQVKGSTSERVEWRAQMKTATGEKLKELQLKHQASLWKQHQKYVQQGNEAKAAEFAKHLKNYGKTYGIESPLKQGVSSPKPDMSKTWVPLETTSAAEFKQSLASKVNTHGIESPLKQGASSPKPDMSKTWVPVETTSAAGFKQSLASKVNTYGIESPLKQTKSIHIGGVSSPKPSIQHDISTPHGNLAQSLISAGITAHVTSSNEVWVSNDKAKQAAEVAKWHPSMQANEDGTVYSQKGVQQAKSSAYVHEPTPDHPAIDFSSLKKVGEQKGSNPGGVYEDAAGQRYYVKSMSKERADNEKLAAKLYALTGAPTLKYVNVKPDGDTHYVATKFEDLAKDNISKFGPYEKQDAQAHFATHAWTANWDAAGTGGDNQGQSKVDGKVKTLDVGGALEYRAKGTPKGDAFGKSVEEFDTLRNGKNADAAKLFGTMTDDQIKKSVDRVSSLDKEHIRKVVASVHGEGTAKTKELTDKLDARRQDLAKRAASIGEHQHSGPDLTSMDDEEVRLYYLKKQNAHNYVPPADSAIMGKKVVKAGGLTPAEVGYIRAFTGAHSGVNSQMRAGVMNEEVFAFKHYMNEALDKMPKHDGSEVYRKISTDDATIKLYEPGKIVHWQAFSSTSKNKNTWSGNVQFIIREPKSGVDVQSISSHPGEAEVIMPADTYYRVVSRKKIGPQTEIVLTEVLPFGKKKKK